MCIAILNKNSVLPIETIKNSFENNPDGAGLCAIIDGKLTYHKELNPKNYKGFYKIYAYYRSLTDLPMLLHFRIGTSGIKDERNIHPFPINRNMALIHNGMLSYNVINKDFSDTWHFTQLLKSLKSPARLLNKNSIEYQMFSAFSKGSKIALLHTSGEFSIMNENSGKWDADNWYSNETYRACDYRNVGGKIVWNNSLNRSYNSLAGYGYDDYGYYGYGYSKSLNPLPIEIKPLNCYGLNPLDKKDFDALNLTERQKLVISIWKDFSNVASAKSYTTVIADVCKYYTCESLYDAYLFSFIDNERNNAARAERADLKQWEIR
jgi:hypothetical protein